MHADRSLACRRKPLLSLALPNPILAVDLTPKPRSVRMQCMQVRSAVEKMLVLFYRAY